LNSSNHKRKFIDLVDKKAEENEENEENEEKDMYDMQQLFCSAACAHALRVRPGLA